MLATCTLLMTKRIHCRVAAQRTVHSALGVYRSTALGAPGHEEATVQTGQRQFEVCSFKVLSLRDPPRSSLQTPRTPVRCVTHVQGPSTLATPNKLLGGRRNLARCCTNAYSAPGLPNVPQVSCPQQMHHFRMALARTDGMRRITCCVPQGFGCGAGC